MLNDFKKIMKKQYGIDNVELTSNFKIDFGLTSFDFINLISIIEAKYKVELDEEDYRFLNTVEDLINYLEQKNAIDIRQ